MGRATPMGHQPLSRQRSAWVPLEESRHAGMWVAPSIPGVRASVRDVADGVLLCFHGRQPIGWHLSISHRRLVKGKEVLVRYPTWDEVAHARAEFLPGDVDFVMALPRDEEFLSMHDTCFQVHEYRDPDRLVQTMLAMLPDQLRHDVVATVNRLVATRVTPPEESHD